MCQNRRCYICGLLRLLFKPKVNESKRRRRRRKRKIHTKFLYKSFYTY